MEHNLNPEILKILAIILGFFRWYRKYSLRITEIYWGLIVFSIFQLASSNF